MQAGKQLGCTFNLTEADQRTWRHACNYPQWHGKHKRRGIELPSCHARHHGFGTAHGKMLLLHMRGWRVLAASRLRKGHVALACVITTKHDDPKRRAPPIHQTLRTWARLRARDMERQHALHAYAQRKARQSGVLRQVQADTYTRGARIAGQTCTWLRHAAGLGIQVRALQGGLDDRAQSAPHVLPL